jgi:hypothetical protein
VLPVIVSLAGCVNTAPWVSKRDLPEETRPTQAVVTWQPRVMVTSDVAHDGVPLPGLAGRLYLFGPDAGCPLTTPGSVRVELYDARTCQPALLETWDIDAKRMQLLLRRDVIGWGYTLFLPWSTYNPAINQVHMKVCFTPENGMPLYAPTMPLRLVDDSCPPPAVVQSTEVPTAAPSTGPMPSAGPNAIQLLPPSRP